MEEGRAFGSLGGLDLRWIDMMGIGHMGSLNYFYVEILGVVSPHGRSPRFLH